MMEYLEISKGRPYPLGVYIYEDIIQFASIVGNDEDAGIILIDKKTGEKQRVPFGRGNRTGNVASVRIKNLRYENYDYNFYSGDEEFVDPYAMRVIGNEQYGEKDEDSYYLRGGIVTDDFDWGCETGVCTPYDKSLIYLLHVRGFTADGSSGVKSKGCFRGVTEKIPYLKSLGITAVELMPCYEFEEFEFPTDKDKEIGKILGREVKGKLNYWGYKKGFYFAPKAGYSDTGNPVNEFKQLVKKLHENKIEVIMQFYFPDYVKQGTIVDALRFWLTVYHVDGFHIKGNNIPITFIATEPIFANTKIWYDYIPVNDIYEYTDKPAYVNLATYSDDYMYRMRRFLKGDEDCLKDVIPLIRENGYNCGKINFFTNYYGFTLNDLVSYERKHNEDNGENNADGCDLNFSWNCGVEGNTRKNSVLALRRKQIKNALAMLFMSQGVPLIFMGDEFLNSQQGNNNPYCLDNEVTHLVWPSSKASKEMTEYFKKLSLLRKESFGEFLGNDYTMVDRDNIGYPDLSYHGEEAYRADTAPYVRHLGIMYANKKDGMVTLLFTAFNMHWQDKEFALPKLPVGAKWDKMFETDESTLTVTGKNSVCTLPGRTVAVLTATFKDNKKSPMPGNAPKLVKK